MGNVFLVFEPIEWTWWSQYAPTTPLGTNLLALIHCVTNSKACFHGNEKNFTLSQFEKDRASAGKVQCVSCLSLDEHHCPENVLLIVACNLKTREGCRDVPRVLFMWAVVWEAGVQGVQAHPQKFWFVENPGKIRENLCKIYETVRKILENLSNNLKMLAKMAPNVVCFWKMGTKGMQNHTKALFDGHPEGKCSWSVWKEIFTQGVARKLFGQVWGNSGKNLSHPQTFACYYTYLCMWVSKGSIPLFGLEGWGSSFRALECFLNMSVLHSHEHNPWPLVPSLLKNKTKKWNKKEEIRRSRSSEWSMAFFIHSHKVMIKSLEVMSKFQICLFCQWIRLDAEYPANKFLRSLGCGHEVWAWSRPRPRF